MEICLLLSVCGGVDVGSMSRAMEGLDEKAAVAMLEGLPVPGQERGLVPSISKTLYHLYK